MALRADTNHVTKTVTRLDEDFVMHLTAHMNIELPDSLTIFTEHDTPERFEPILSVARETYTGVLVDRVSRLVAGVPGATSGSVLHDPWEDRLVSDRGASSWWGMLSPEGLEDARADALEAAQTAADAERVYMVSRKQ